MTDANLQKKPGLLRRAAVGGGKLLRKPPVALLKLIVRKLESMEPQKAVRLVARFRGILALPQRARRRKNLELIAGKSRWTAAQKKEIERRHIEYLTRVDLHLLRLPHITPEEFFRAVTARGEEHVANALKLGKGLLLITTHAGTWWHSGGWVAARGFPVRVAVNPTLPAPLAKLMIAATQRFGAKIIHVGDNAYGAARECFQAGEVFMAAVDISIRGERSKWLPFGEAEFPMDPGPAILALRQRVPVVWATSYHDEAGRSCVEFLPPMQLGHGTAWATPEAVMRGWLDLMYQQWQRHPEQWWPLSFCSLRAGGDLKSPSSSTPT